MWDREDEVADRDRGNVSGGAEKAGETRGIVTGNSAPADVEEEFRHLLYVISHDLPEPLRMVTGYLGLIEKRYGEALGEDGNEFLGFAVDGAQRMNAMLEGLLQYSRIGRKELELESVDMGKMVEHACDQLATAIEESGASIEYDNLPCVQADSASVVLLLRSLLDNAIKFRGEEKPVIRVGFEGEAGVTPAMAEFSVTDNGIGFPIKDSERIFKVFQRLHTREQYPGTGMGLTLCRSVVNRHGGAMSVESEEGQGSVFRFSLPAA